MLLHRNVRRRNANFVSDLIVMLGGISVNERLLIYVFAQHDRKRGSAAPKRRRVMPLSNDSGRL